MATDVELAYLAGIIDGEGTICVYRRAHGRRGHDVYVAIYNTSADLIVWANSLFGGRAYFNERNERSGKSTRFGTLPIHRVTWNSRPVIASLLREVIPYLIIKKDLADMAIQFCGVESWETELQQILYDGIRQRQSLQRMDRLTAKY